LAQNNTDRSNGSAPPVQAPINEYVKDKQVEDKHNRHWPTVAIAVTYAYLSEGIRILGEAYSMYDDRNIQ
jgi:hypothetical protein